MSRQRLREPADYTATLRLLRTVDALSAAAGVIAALLLAGVFILMMGEVAARNFMNRSLHFSWELGSYGMGGIFAMGAAAAMARGEHVRVGIALELLPQSMVRWVELIVSLAGVLIATYVAHAVGQLAMRSFEGDVRSFSGLRVRLWMPQALLAAGLGLLALQLAARALRTLLGLPAEAQTPEQADEQR